MLAELAARLDYALITVRRLLRQVGYFRSFTHNGKWYTLRTLPSFNRLGIWHYQGIGFSKHGNLTATIVLWVAQSPAGLSARELADRLEHPCHAVLTLLHKQGQLDRIQVGSQFQYLSLEPTRNQRQRNQLAAHPSGSSSSLSTQAAVLVLVEHIKHPELSFEQLAAQLQRQRQLTVSVESIRQFFQEQDLKKTPGTRTPSP
jgi:transposase